MVLTSSWANRSASKVSTLMLKTTINIISLVSLIHRYLAEVGFNSVWRWTSLGDGEWEKESSCSFIFRSESKNLSHFILKHLVSSWLNQNHFSRNVLSSPCIKASQDLVLNSADVSPFITPKYHTSFFSFWMFLIDELSQLIHFKDVPPQFF